MTKAVYMILVTLMQLSGDVDKTRIIASTIYGECADQVASDDCKCAVASVIWKAADKPINGISLANECAKPGRYCCWLKDHIEIDISSQAWCDCKLLAREMVSGVFEPSIDADFFLSGSGAPPHEWGAVEYVETIGGLRFWRKVK